MAWIEACHRIGRAYGLTPQEVWTSFTFRQIKKFLSYILYDDQVDFYIQGAVHGADMHMPPHPDDKNTHRDFSDLQDPETAEYEKLKESILGQHS